MQFGFMAWKEGKTDEMFIVHSSRRNTKKDLWLLRMMDIELLERKNLSSRW